VRTRLSPEQRREQLLDLGAELFATQPYEDVHIERVAELAGVSRGLLYHYFPNKRAFFAALLERAMAHMMSATAPDPALSPLEQLYAGIEHYLDYCRANMHGSQAIHRGAASGDPEVIAAVEKDTRMHQERILAVLDPSGQPDPLLVIAVASWILFLRTACQEWLVTDEVKRDDVRDLCASALIHTIANLPAEARPAQLDELLAR
jgi:AcrR family transcriptional regulator